MKSLTTSVLILTLNALWATCRAVPLMDLKNTLNGDDLQAELPPGCSPDAPCWGWLPVQEVQENDAIVPDSIAMSRLHTRRQIPSAATQTALDAWNDNLSPLDKKFQTPSQQSRLGSRLVKKDVFLSRSWGAGGMPFSVLYMSPHGPRANHAGTAQQLDAGKATETPSPSLGQPNYRIALRNGANGQPRRQYSIIPQLFISYGWGSLGK